ncbi:MAG TPA: hypothetical protein VFI09_00990 [Solirubrobacterales bacterium]|nr:hypothetical protein [Solirubrobacterales bacterium]
MKIRIAVAVGALALAASPAALAVGKPQGTPPHGKGQGAGPGVTYTPAEGTPENANAYGRNCQGKSKKHVKGEKGTEFSRCVHDVVKLRQQEHKKAREERQKEREEYESS